MKRKDELKELRGKPVEDLSEDVSKLERELLNLRFRHTAGQMPQTAQFTSIRRKIARTKTIISEKQSASQN